LLYITPQSDSEDYNPLKSAGRLSGKVRVVCGIAASNRILIT